MAPIIRAASGRGFHPKPAFRWLHRWLGLLAGLVLAVVGGTGALMSFEEDVLWAINDGVMRVGIPEGASALPLADLVARIQSQQPESALATLRVSTVPGESAWVGFRAKGKPVGEFVNPYTGELLGKARGAAFFRTVEDLHRRLLAGAAGKAITGASVVILIGLVVSGLMIRLRRAGLKYWLVPAQRGTAVARIYSLHAVLGVWLLLPLLLAAMTGLYWSYDWTRQLWHNATGAPQGKPVAMKVAAVPHAPVASNGGQIPWLAIAQMIAEKSARHAQIFLPNQPNEAIRVSWQGAEPAHSRAQNTLQLHPITAAVLLDQPFADLPPGTQLVRSMLPLHTGEYFGRAGVWIMFAGSLSLPLFFLSGAWLYLRRWRRAKPIRPPVG